MDMLKKILLLLLALTMVFCFAACGEEEPEETEPTLNKGDKNCEHVWSDWEITKENSCAKNGMRERECTACGREEEETLLAFGHDYFDGICSECGKEAKDCDHPEIYTVVVSEATCTEDGMERQVCKLCRGVVSYNHIGAYWHYDTETVVVLEPTCTENGLEQEICKLCGEVAYEHTLWSNGHGATEYQVIQDATCTENGLGQEICTVCGEVAYEYTLWSNGHDYEYIDSKSPTCTEIGWNSYRKCTVCSYLYNYKEKEATGHSYSFGNCVNCGLTDSSFSVVDLSGSVVTEMVVSQSEAVIYTAETGFVSTTTGNIADKNTKEVWTLNVTVPGRYFIWLNDIYSGYYMKMYVYNSLGERVANDSTIYNKEGLYMDLEVGVYTVEISYGSGASTYNINVGSAKPSVDISAYDKVLDQMEFAYQKNVYTFVPAVNGKYYFSLSEMTGNASMYMGIYNRLNERVSYDSYISNGEGLSVEMVAGETYTLYIASNEGYKTTYQLNIGKQKPLVAIDGYNQIQDNISFYSQYNVYQFVATSSDVRIETINMGASSQVDIYLYNYLNERVSYDTYCYNGEGINSSKLTVGQTYTIKVFYRNEPTAYTLRVMTPAATTTVKNNSAITDTMEYYGQVNNYGVTANADGEIRITLRVDSYEGNRYLSFYVYDANGNKLTSDDYVYSGDYITIKNVTAGSTYYLRVTSYTANMIYAVEFK